jgi:predicted porin
MRRRYVIMGLTVAIALALAVPALGGPSNPVASSAAGAKKLANKALKTANAANSAAQQAQSTANQALSTANQANSTANAANTAANATIGASRIGRQFATGDSGTPTSDESQTGSTACPGNKVAVGGGGAILNDTAVASDPIALTGDIPFIYDSWISTGEEMSAVAGTWHVLVEEICINP